MQRYASPVLCSGRVLTAEGVSVSRGAPYTVIFSVPITIAFTRFIPKGFRPPKVPQLS
jgi:hypothetical protein